MMGYKRLKERHPKEHEGYPQSLSLRLVVAVASLVCFVACAPTMHGYKQIRESDQYIAGSTRAEIVQQGLAREQVIARLGDPDRTNEEVRSIGYSRCIKSRGWGVFGPADVDSCQRVVFWFDEAGRAFAQREGVAHCSEDAVCFGRSLVQWLAEPPESAVRKK